MIKCEVKGIYVGFSDLPSRNGNTTSRCIDIYVSEFRKSVQVFRCDRDFNEGTIVSLSCELRLRQDGSPYFVYSPPVVPDAQQSTTPGDKK